MKKNSRAAAACALGQPTLIEGAAARRPDVIDARRVFELGA